MTLILLLASAGIVLLVAEMLLPTHGVLGVMGLLCIAAGVVVVFFVNKWTGLAVLLGLVLASPFIVNFAINLWAKSPVGRKIILQPLDRLAPVVAVNIGQTGTAITAMRPLGECDFGEQRLEALSELGIIQPGQKVKIVSINNGRPTVRAVEA